MTADDAEGVPGEVQIEVRYDADRGVIELEPGFSLHSVPYRPGEPLWQVGSRAAAVLSTLPIVGLDVVFTEGGDDGSETYTATVRLDDGAGRAGNLRVRFDLTPEVQTAIADALSKPA